MTIIKIGELNMTLSKIRACIPRELHVDSDVASTITKTSFIIFTLRPNLTIHLPLPTSFPTVFPSSPLSPQLLLPPLSLLLYFLPPNPSPYSAIVAWHRFGSMVQLGTPSFRGWLSATLLPTFNWNCKQDAVKSISCCSLCMQVVQTCCLFAADFAANV